MSVATTNVIHFPHPHQAGEVVSPALLAGRSAPPREWLVPNLIPKGKVTLLTGDGGVGKSRLAQQLWTAVATGRDFLDMQVTPGRPLALFCEDDNDEVWRRQVEINKALGLAMDDLHQGHWISGVGVDCALMSFEGGDAKGRFTTAFADLLATAQRIRPDLIIVDTVADTFAGNENDRGQVNRFIKAGLGRFCSEIGATVLLCGHPSRSGLQTGDGASGSTAWNNAVRSRLYLTRPDRGGRDDRLLSAKKSNYGPAVDDIHLRWSAGVFAVDDDSEQPFRPIDESEYDPAEIAYLTALATCLTRGEELSPALNQAHYVIKRLMREPAAKKQSRQSLEQAHGRLMQRGVIKIRVEGRASREKKRIAFAEADIAESFGFCSP